ncbi:uncharacterized protein LOC126313394 isoform X2 [Schistocerca gregaria]|uniref:uncharacterized protein LOC126313394 isoform X2 n=1 Tax=Schistocerca gregaria TaxID=7010 RepID=UPI00211E9C5E|nr:uncharacterized protein LOC126313394 isoform X2 [Schistocerca gregaria]XP_049848299.1 uncharacterized protein LOC126313394 isoform X2 [Schistocerca gregaria]
MSLLACFLQQLDGTNIAVQTRCYMHGGLIYQLTKEFAQKIQKIKKKNRQSSDDGSVSVFMGPSRPDLCNGKLVVSHYFEVTYCFFSDMYIGVIHHADGNPFVPDVHLAKVKSCLVSVMKAEKFKIDELARKYTDVVLMLERLMRESWPDASWVTSKPKEVDNLVFDKIFSFEFEMPKGSLEQRKGREERQADFPLELFEVNLPNEAEFGGAVDLQDYVVGSKSENCIGAEETGASDQDTQRGRKFKSMRVRRRLSKNVPAALSRNSVDTETVKQMKDYC